MNLRQLQILEEVVATGSLTQAAYRLGISQPAVSSAIASLEEDVGFLLFKRSRTGATVTPEARIVANEARKVLAASHTLETLARDLRHGQAGRLKVGCLPGFSPVFMPRLVAHFLESHKGARISLQTHSSERIGLWVAAGHWDIGIMELADPAPALKIEPFSVPMVCALPIAHRLRDRGTISVQDLDDEPLVTLDPNHQVTVKLRSVFRHAGARMRVRVESHLFPPACMLVAQGVGVAIIDSVTALDYPGQDVVFRPFRPRLEFDLAVVFPRYQTLSRQCHAFAAALETALQEQRDQFQTRGF